MGFLVENFGGVVVELVIPVVTPVGIGGEGGFA